MDVCLPRLIRQVLRVTLIGGELVVIGMEHDMG